MEELHRPPKIKVDYTQTMRSVVFLDTYYGSFMTSDLFVRSVRSGSNYQDSINKIESLSFGTGSSYVNAFRSLGWKADLLIPNSYHLQNRWSEQNLGKGLISPGWEAMQIMSRVPILREMARWIPYYYSVVEQQIKELSPDLIVVQDLNAFPPKMVKRLSQYARKIIGEIASPPPPKSFFSPYDRIVSALPSLVRDIEATGCPSSYLPLAFDERNARFTPYCDRDIDVAFVGSFGRHQPKTAKLLRQIGEYVPGLQIYGNLTFQQAKEYGLSEFHKGEAWGQEMFRILARSKIAINRHGTIAGNYAVNMRMYEATGCGAMLVTENKRNLDHLFKVDNEVITYDSAAEAAEKISYYMCRPTENETIALRGQQRTLVEHTYVRRAEKLVEIFQKDLSASKE